MGIEASKMIFSALSGGGTDLEFFFGELTGDVACYFYF